MYMKKHLLKILAAFSLCPTLALSEPFDSLLEEDVDVVVSMRSLAETREAWETHPFAELVADPELQAFFAPLMEDEAAEDDEEQGFSDFVEDELGLTLDEFLDLFPGQISIVMFNLPEMMLEDVERPEMALMAEYSGDGERIREIMRKLHEHDFEVRSEDNPDFENKLIEESFIGETLYLDEIFDGEETYIENGYALVDGIFVFADPESRLRSMVEAIKDGPDSPLSENAAYLRSRDRGGRGDLSFYLNLEAIMPPLNKAMLDQSMESGAAMLGLSARSLDAALSLESMLALFLDVDLIEDGLSSHSGIIYREKAGIMSLITYDEGPLPEARYVPGSVFSTSITTFNLGAMLAQLEKLIGAASPTAMPMLDMQMQNVKTQTGIDLRESILQNFGGGLVSLSTLPAADRDDTALLQPEQVILLELENPDALSGAIEALIDLAPGTREMIEVQEFAGERIHTIKPIQDPSMADASGENVSYVITRTHFIMNIGKIGLLQEVLTRMESGEDGFWQGDDVDALFEDIAMDNAVSRSYVDLEPMVSAMFQSFVDAMALGVGDFYLDEDLIPEDLDVPFYGVTEANEEEDGIFSRSLLKKKETAN